MIVLVFTKIKKICSHSTAGANINRVCCRILTILFTVICLSESIWSSSPAIIDDGSGFEIQQRNQIIAVHWMGKEGLQKVQIIRSD